MRKFKLLLSLLFLLLASFIALADVGTTALSSSNLSINFSLIAGTPVVRTLLLSNNNNYTIYNIAMTNTADLTFTNVTKLDSGKNVSVNITALSSVNYDRTVSPKITFTYQENITTSPKNYSMTVTNSGFVPPNIDVIAGSTITFFNNVYFRY